MKKKILLMLMALMLSTVTIVGCGNKDNNEQKQDANNQQNEITEDEDNSVKKEYDDNGNVIKETHYKEVDGSLVLDYSYVYEYDAKNQVVKETLYDDNGEMCWYIDYEYNDNGDKTSYISYMPDGTISLWYKDVYDDNNYLLLSLFYDAIEGAIVDWYEYENEYDSSNNIQKITCYVIKGNAENFNGTLDCFKETSRNIVKVEEYVNGVCNKVSDYSDGLLKCVTEIKYDSEGKIEATRETDYDDNGLIESITEYDSAERMTLFLDYENGEYDGKIVMEYDSEGNQTKEIFYDKNDKLRAIDDYKNGIVAKTTFYYQDGNVNFIYKYDENGNKIEYTDYYENGQLYQDKKYNSEGELIGYVSYYENGNLKIECEYDKNDQLTKKTFYKEDGTLDYWNEYEYDEDGNQTDIISYDKDGNIID